MYEKPKELETFQKLISEKMGIDFLPYKPGPSRFLVSIKAFPKKLIGNERLLSGIKECLSAIGFELDESSISLDRDFTWMEMKNKEEDFFMGITNSAEPICIIITIMRF
jgi:hypothetical protein